MKKNKHILVIGGGAAGMLAAISAKRLGVTVTILEKNPRVGKKILATGNGRCNFTNVNADITCFSGENPQFAQDALKTFTVEDTLRFFSELGIQPKVEEQGKVFPMSDQASSILDVLLYELQDLGVNIVTEANVVDLTKKQDRFVISLENGQQYKGDNVIIATGGKALPSSGSDGKAYDLVTKLGHTRTDIFPALVQIMLDGKFFKRIEGVKFVGTAEIIHQGKNLALDRGDILFANYGVSGPAILQLSRIAGELLQKGQKPELKITIIDTMSLAELRRLLENRFKLSGNKPLDFSLVGLINKRLIPVILTEAGFTDLKRPAASLSGEEQEKICRILTDWRMKIRGTKGWTSAQVTAGGINTNEINPQTMESKLVPGLYFAGELIDIDGKCGGFNLQWAWSSGYTAGKNAAR